MRVLVIAPHADDETLGMGGSIARFISDGHEVHVALLTGAGQDGCHPFIPAAEFAAVRAEFDAALDVLGVKHRHLRNLPAVLVEETPVHEINTVARDLVAETRPDRLYLPFAFDLHLDHRRIFYSFAVQWRAYLPLGMGIREVYCYETASETHLAPAYLEPAFSPNAFVDISPYIEKKLSALDCYRSQKQAAPLPRSREAIEAQARYRGAQIGAAAAEAFVMIRMVER
jgi:LmbE family N-acetylglucosaminyl deacetylase